MSNDQWNRIWAKPEKVQEEQKDLLAKMIIPFASIDPDNGKIYFRAAFSDLNAKQKILVYLLCRLAYSLQPESKAVASTSPKEIENALKLPGGTVRPKLSQLQEEGITVKKDDGYVISGATLNEAYRELQSFISEPES